VTGSRFMVGDTGMINKGKGVRDVGNSASGYRVKGGDYFFDGSHECLSVWERPALDRKLNLSRIVAEGTVGIELPQALDHDTAVLARIVDRVPVTNLNLVKDFGFSIEGVGLNTRPS